MLKENSRKVWDYLMSVDGADVTLNDVAENTGLNVKQANGCLVGLQKKSLVTRVESDQKADGKVVKFIYLTDAGKALDPDAE